MVDPACQLVVLRASRGICPQSCSGRIVGHSENARDGSRTRANCRSCREIPFAPAPPRCGKSGQMRERHTALRPRTPLRMERTAIRATARTTSIWEEVCRPLALMPIGRPPHRSAAASRYAIKTPKQCTYLLQLHRVRRPLGPLRRLLLQPLHEFGDAALQLRVLALDDRLRIVVHFDIRIYAVPLDDPLAFQVGESELRNVHRPAVDQLAVVRDADHASPRPLPDQRPQSG